MRESASSIFQTHILEALRRGVLGGRHLQDHLRARPQGQLVDPHIEVVRPLVDGHHQGPRVFLEPDRVAVEVVTGAEPERPLGQHSRADDPFRLNACCVVWDFLHFALLLVQVSGITLILGDHLKLKNLP